MDQQQAALYQRIQTFALDQPGTQARFSQRLARENGWTADYAQRVIAEYKKFAFLAVAAGHPVSPSDAVDQAWHLHLTYTRSYWEQFCTQVLQTPFHHEPGQGGSYEKAKFTDWYQQTLTSYQQFFGEPPTDIWPPTHLRFGEPQQFVRLNTTAHWVIPKNILPRPAIALSLLLLALVIAGCTPC